MKGTSHVITTSLSVVISLAVIIYVVNQLDWRATYNTLIHLNWGWLLAAWLVFVLNYILRTLRFRLLIYSLNISFRQLLSVTSLYGMFNYLMPAKSGEFSFLLLLNRRLEVSLTKSTAILIVARFFDFATIALFLPAVLIAFWQRLPAGLVYSSLAFCGLIYILGGGILWLLRTPKAIRLSINHDKLLTHLWLSRLLKIWQNLIEGIRLIDQRGQYRSLWVLTIGIWLCVYTNFYFIALSMGYQLNYVQMVVVSIIMVPMTLLPFQGIANLGTHEAGWVIALTLFGLPQEVSVNVAVGSHMILLLFVLLLGGLGLLLGIRSDYCKSISSRGADV